LGELGVEISEVSSHLVALVQFTQLKFTQLKFTQLSAFLRSPLAGLVLVIGVILVPLALKIYVSQVTEGDRYTEPAKVPPQPVAIVFGAGVYADGTPSPMLADRVNGAVQLYRQKRIQKILMTGDNSSTDYDEVTVMKRYAMTLGVPEKDITLDYAGFNTYESCYRAKAIFGVRQAVLVTQRYHLPRAVYNCRQLGVTVVGLGTPDWESYGTGVMVPYVLREIFSTVKAVWEVNVTRPNPTFLGPFEGIK
jgi:vancomycin permeability regulator SanA